MATQDEEIMSVVDGALEGTLPEPGISDETEGEPEPTEPEEHGEGEGEPEESEEPTESEEGEERTRGPDGKFLKKGEKAPEETKEPEAKPPKGKVKSGPDAPEQKQADPVNDPIAKDTKPETAARIRALIDINKEVTTQRDAVVKDFDTMVEGVRRTGASPQQYGEVLSWLSLFYSPNPAHQKQAYDLVESVAERLAMKLGIERKLPDPLTGHADLQQAVQQKQLTPEYALQIATQRNSQKFNAEMQQQTATVTQEQQQYQQATQQAKADLTTLGNTLAATDPDYERKRALIVPILKPMFEKLHPTQWKGAFETAYRNVVLQAAAQPRQRQQIPDKQPARARGSVPSGGAQGDKSIMDVMNQALSEV